MNDCIRPGCISIFENFPPMMVIRSRTSLGILETDVIVYVGARVSKITFSCLILAKKWNMYSKRNFLEKFVSLKMYCF